MREFKLEILIYFILLILLSGFFKLQMVQGTHYKKISESNRIRTIPLISARGRIYDRDGVPLADNKPILNLSLIPDDFNFDYLERIAEIIDEEPGVIREKIQPFIGTVKGSHPVLIKKDLNQSITYRIEELSTLLGGVHIDRGSLRYYPEEELTSHVVGYIGKINPKEYRDNKHRGWLINDSVGRIGVEKTFNEELMGSPGGQQVEVDALGQKIRLLSKKDPAIGKDLHLSIDAGLQDRIYDIIDHEKDVAIAVMDVTNGEILSLVSTPAFDPNIFVNPNLSFRRSEVLTNERFPTINRTISLQYSPGSVFKVLVALAALEEKIINENTTFNCRGAYQMNSRSRPFRCWNEDGHGDVNLVKAIERSCNIYFYRVGLRLGNEKIARYARMFGLGEKIDLDLPYGKSGLVPDALWKLKTLKERWYPGETLNYSIGQGFLLVTPLQIAKMTAAVANGGKLVEPSIEKGKKVPSRNIPIHPNHFKRVRYAMLRAIESAEGTGQLAQPSVFKMGGKTGTAQTFGEPHSWYAGFFPYDKPKIAIVVLVEHGGAGSGIAAEYAGAIADEWLLYQRKKKRITPGRL